VYGTLRKGLSSPAYELISRYFNLTGNAKVNGVLYNLGQYPGALPANSPFVIIGELYRIKDTGLFDEAMARLDDYEGLVVGPGEIPLYRREIVTVYAGNTTINAWIYWYNRPVTNEPLIECGNMLEYLNTKTI
jgi:Uncharacterized conserved protein